MSGASFDGKKATIVGNGATIAFLSTSSSVVEILNGSELHMRDIVVDDIGPKDPDVAPIVSRESIVTIDNMQGNTKIYETFVSTSGRATITNSVFAYHPIVISEKSIADRCQFLSGGPIVSGSVEITNSVIVANSTQRVISVVSQNSSFGSITISHNTIIGGIVFCQLVNSVAKFDNNILYNSSIEESSDSCAYRYNLTFPQLAITGLGNTTGDPLFVDPANGDFRLRAGSPAIDAADPVMLLTGHDLDGTRRPQGTRSDIGAFEHVR